MATQAQIENLKHWKYLVACKDTMSWPDNGVRYLPKDRTVVAKRSTIENVDAKIGVDVHLYDRYDNFNHFVSQFIDNVLSGNKTGIDGMDEETEAFNTLGYDDEEDIISNYWNLLMHNNDDKDLVHKGINAIDDPTDENKQKVYDAFMPAYRAIKERFEKRWFIEWIFNHKEYTTERNTIKAMKSLMTALTRDGDDVFKAKYQEYKNNVVLSEADENDIATKVADDTARFKATRKAERDAEKAMERKAKNEEPDDNLYMSMDCDDVDADIAEYVATVNKDKQKLKVEELDESNLNQKIEKTEAYRNVPSKELNNSINSSL